MAALSGAALPDLLRQAVETVAGVLSVEYCEVLELLPDGSGLLLRAGVGWREDSVGRATMGVNLESQAGYTMISREPVVVEDLRSERRFGESSLLREHGVIGGMSVRIEVHGRAYGVLGAHTTRKHSFAEDEVMFLREVAGVLGAAIEREQEERDTRRALVERAESAAAAERRFEFLAEANALLSTSTDYQTVLATAARLGVPAIADWCFVDVVDEDGGKIERTVAAHPEDAGRLASEPRSSYYLDPNVPHGTPRVLRTGRPEIIPEVEDEVLAQVARDARRLEALRRMKPESYMCVPLRVGGRTLGAVGMISAGSGRRYGDEDLLLAEGLAHCTALALDNARHHVSEVRLARELVERSRREQREQAATPKSRDAPDLTARQLEVLEMISAGRSAREIGAHLYLSEATVRNHIRSLLQALDAHSQLEAVAHARRAGLISE